MTSQFLINEPPLQFFPTLARKIGLNETILLQQVHYWLNLDFSRHFFEGRYWVRYIPRHWQRQFSFWDKKTIRGAIAILEDLGLLESFVADRNGHVKYYTIDYQQLEEWSRPLPFSKLPEASSPNAYDHANFDAINKTGGVN